MTKIEPTIGSVLTDESAEIESLCPNLSEQELRLSYPLASLGRRHNALLLDVLLTYGLFVGGMYLKQIFGLNHQYADYLVVAVAASYFLFSDGLPKGKSLGKRALGISVVNVNSGAYCSYWQSFLRNILIPATSILDVVILFSKKRRRIGDYLGSTMVINDKIS
ncbi:RDD family protein [Vibrio sp. WXL210]|uniref:RDD family protein n=1 Tax=Vibrio sp. WXL210 TaxID=3450709 RepID=UPI003EC86C75